jgi:hypothetical protein
MDSGRRVGITLNDEVLVHVEIHDKGSERAVLGFDGFIEEDLEVLLNDL